MIKKLFLLALIHLAFDASSQIVKVGFYNVENLFDTIDDPKKDDKEFLPTEKMQWNQKRYNEKLDHINKVMTEMGNLLILGMCEIENEAVVRDVLKVSKYAKSHGVVHYESPDERGIDVGMIYDSTKLKVLKSGNIRFTLPGKEKPSSRDIVWAKFLYKKDTLFAMINHWPSRRGGADDSEKNRIEAAKNARHFIDSVELKNPKYKLILMGDLNDYPENIAPKMVAEKLTEMICKESGEFGGSYLHDGEWNVLDHIMVSSALRGKKGVKTIAGSGKIYSPAFLIEEYKGKKQPFRTYAGSKYLGGYSDHLPVTIDIKL
ncbi:MAG: endonuclease [Flavobacteriia bacterium]